MATPQELKDAELLRLASAATQPGTGEVIPPQPGAGPGAMGLDLSAFDTPNQPSGSSPPNPSDREELAQQSKPPEPAGPPPLAPDGTPVAPGTQGTTTPTDDVSGAIDDAKAEPGPPQTPTPLTPPSRTPTTPTEKGSVEALNQAQRSGYAAASAKANEGAFARQKSELDADALGKSELQHRQDADEIATKQKAIEEGRSHVQAIRDAAYQDLKDFKFFNFWRDADQSDRMDAKIAIMLGAWGSSGPYAASNRNVALDEINSNIDRQHKLDEAEVRKRYDIAKLREQGAAQFESNMQSDLATMKFKQAATSLAVADRMKAEMLRNGIPLEQAQNDTSVRQMIAKADQADAEGYEKLMAVHGNLALRRAQMDASRPDSPAVQTAVSDYLKDHIGDQAGAMRVATKAGSKDPSKIVGTLIKEGDKQEAERNKALAKVGNANAAFRRERIAANIHDMGEGLNSIPTGVITPEVLDIVQKNRAEVHATSHPDSIGSAFANNLGRKFHAVAKSEFDGLTEEQTAAMRGLQRALQHGSEMQPAQGAEVKKGYIDTYTPQPGTDQSSIDNALKALKQQHDDYKSIIDQGNIGGRADKQPATSSPSKGEPGSTVVYKGKMYTVGDDGDTLEPVK
jgi:hypothetical protein